MANKNGRRRVTQRDVAERAGVSTSVVSYVINHGPRSVSPETRARVLDVVEELGYRPNRHAQFLMRSKWQSGTAVRDFGIIFGHTSSLFVRSYYGEVLAGIYDEANALHMRVRFAQFLNELSDPLLFNELIDPDEISGLILMAVETDSLDPPSVQIIQRILERIDNVVSVERPWGALPAVYVDRQEAARMAVNHLLHLGHRRIGFLGAVDDRLAGYRQALSGCGVALDGHLICSLPGGNTPSEGYSGIRRLLAIEQPPTAIFTCSDEIAIGAICSLQEMGLGVPGDMALASVDDIPVARYLAPGLTTMHIPKSEMGAQGVRMLHDRAMQPGEVPDSVVLPTTLMVRHSCGANGVVSQEPFLEDPLHRCP
jgi:LacI family transcriptional regulator